jgi:hypothetical protein
MFVEAIFLEIFDNIYVKNISKQRHSYFLAYICTYVHCCILCQNEKYLHFFWGGEIIYKNYSTDPLCLLMISAAVRPRR